MARENNLDTKIKAPRQKEVEKMRGRDEVHRKQDIRENKRGVSREGKTRIRSIFLIM